MDKGMSVHRPSAAELARTDPNVMEVMTFKKREKMALLEMEKNNGKKVKGEATIEQIKGLLKKLDPEDDPSISDNTRKGLRRNNSSKNKPQSKDPKKFQGELNIQELFTPDEEEKQPKKLNKFSPELVFAKYGNKTKLNKQNVFYYNVKQNSVKPSMPVYSMGKPSTATSLIHHSRRESLSNPPQPHCPLNDHPDPKSPGPEARYPSPRHTLPGQCSTSKTKRLLQGILDFTKVMPRPPVKELKPHSLDYSNKHLKDRKSTDNLRSFHKQMDRDVFNLGRIKIKGRGLMTSAKYDLVLPQAPVIKFKTGDYTGEYRNVQIGKPAPRPHFIKTRKHGKRHDSMHL